MSVNAGQQDKPDKKESSGSQDTSFAEDDKKDEAQIIDYE